MRLIPHRCTAAGRLCVSVNDLISDLSDTDWCTYNQSLVSGAFDSETLVTRILPLSIWWQRKIEPAVDQALEFGSHSWSDSDRQAPLQRGRSGTQLMSRIRQRVYAIACMRLFGSDMSQDACQCPRRRQIQIEFTRPPHHGDGAQLPYGDANTGPGPTIRDQALFETLQLCFH